MIRKTLEIKLQKYENGSLIIRLVKVKLELEFLNNISGIFFFSFLHFC